MHGDSNSGDWGAAQLDLRAAGLGIVRRPKRDGRRASSSANIFSPPLQRNMMTII
jgi:hypothetical protein